MNLSMIKGLIFDMDGTITLTEALHHKAFAEVFKSYGISYDLETHVRRFAGAGSKTTFETIFKEKWITVSPQEIEQCQLQKKALYTKFVQEEEISVVPGVLAFVDRVQKKGLRKIIATGNSNLDAVRFILKKVGLLEYFPEILSITEVARGKPFPDVFIEAAKRMGLLNTECVVLEDALNGIEAAKAAGIRAIAFSTTTNPKDLFAAGATRVLKDYTELTDEILYA